MTMQPYNGDIKQALKWMQNNAPNVQSLVNQKSNWYLQYHTQFWSDWERDVFNLATANPFGLMVWCIILGVPASLFGLYPAAEFAWAYGNQRQNFVYSGVDPSIDDKNLIGGNFFGGSNTTVLSLQEVRWALRLRYVALVSNGRISFINKMLRWIFNDDLAWDFAGKRYFYLTDATAPAQVLTPTPPVTSLIQMEYRVGANMNLSSQFINMLNESKYGIAPSCAGIKYTVIQEA